MKKICAVKNCNEFVHGVGYCGRHYKQFRKHGKIISTVPLDIYHNNRIVISNDIAIMDLYNKNGDVIKTTIFDACYEKTVKNFKWSMSHQYVRTSVGKNAIYLHHLIGGHPINGFVTDHRNRNRLDNRKQNLRIVSYHINAINRTRLKKNKTGCTGVYWDKKNKKWRVQIESYGNIFFIGRFKSKNKAIVARTDSEKKYWGVNIQKKG